MSDVQRAALHALFAGEWDFRLREELLANNTALMLLNIANEVDRYIAWPAQAVADKMGELNDLGRL